MEEVFWKHKKKKKKMLTITISPFFYNVLSALETKSNNLNPFSFIVCKCCGLGMHQNLPPGQNVENSDKYYTINTEKLSTFWIVACGKYFLYQSF